MPSKRENIIETVPVIKEQIIIDKRTIDTAKVSVSKMVKDRDVQIDISEEHDDIQIERVSVNQIVKTEPTARHEGDTLIIPVLREEVVIEKKLVLVEEVRITRKKKREVRREDINLREEEINISREELNNSGNNPNREK